ncbi:Rrf2 family transcriptional regulator [Myxococcota bacterium]|nr:Rrf2 family transcriptional regulator [Myxococcota bacterium]MBU1536733.1 Rrf2 family transcriptional regulator [Myxococcota bacterium]
MKISTKVRYATRAMLELALLGGQSPVLIETIAKNQDLSKKYLETLLNVLKNNGMVKSVRGKGGGYRLNVDPEEVTVRDIYVAIEGTHAVVECIGGEDHCMRSDICATQELWNEITDSLLDILERHTLADLVRRTQEKQRHFHFMYYI